MRVRNVRSYIYLVKGIAARAKQKSAGMRKKKKSCADLIPRRFTIEFAKGVCVCQEYLTVYGSWIRKQQRGNTRNSSTEYSPLISPNIATYNVHLPPTPK